MALKELEARYATKRAKDYKLTDGQGLYLLVRPNGSKLWRMKYRFGNKEKLLAFGAYPDVSLAAARLRRAEAKLALGRVGIRVPKRRLRRSRRLKRLRGRGTRIVKRCSTPAMQPVC